MIGAENALRLRVSLSRRAAPMIMVVQLQPYLLHIALSHCSLKQNARLRSITTQSKHKWGYVSSWLSAGKHEEHNEGTSRIKMQTDRGAILDNSPPSEQRGKKKHSNETKRAAIRV